jgi:hypothetical protein
MRQTYSVAVLIALLSGSAVAIADDYPTAIIDRPLALPPSTFQPSAALALIHDSTIPAPLPSNTDAMILGLDAGVAPHLQVGAFAAIVVSPSSRFETALASGQYAFLAFAAVRVDAGVQRVDSGSRYAAVGVGLPVRLKLNNLVALISGRPYAYGAEDDLVSLRFDSLTSGISELRLPVGLLFQITPNFSFAVRSGVRRQGGASYIPIGADVTYAVSRIDVGVTLDIAGQVGPANGSGYTDLTTVRGWAQVRL